MQSDRRNRLRENSHTNPRLIFSLALIKHLSRCMTCMYDNLWTCHMYFTSMSMAAVYGYVYFERLFAHESRLYCFSKRTKIYRLRSLLISNDDDGTERTAPIVVSSFQIFPIYLFSSRSHMACNRTRSSPETIVLFTSFLQWHKIIYDYILPSNFSTFFSQFI